MICFEENTNKSNFEFGFNKITSQNLLRKITESIEILKTAVQVFIYLEEEIW
jgi:hypothetical protein